MHSVGWEGVGGSLQPWVGMAIVASAPPALVETLCHYCSAYTWRVSPYVHPFTVVVYPAVWMGMSRNAKHLWVSRRGELNAAQAHDRSIPPTLFLSAVQTCFCEPYNLFLRGNSSPPLVLESPHLVFENHANPMSLRAMQIRFTLLAAGLDDILAKVFVYSPP